MNIIAIEVNATRGKCSMGGDDGFKLHLMVNDQGGFLAFRIATGEGDDRDRSSK